MYKKHNRISSSRGGIYPQIQQILEENCEDGFRTLEIGSGSKRISRELMSRFDGLETLTLDINKNQNPDVVADISRDSPFKDDSFDLCFSEGVLEHEPIDYIKAILESVRVADSSIHFIPNGGNLVYRLKKTLSRITGIGIYSKVDKEYGFERSITKGDLEKKLLKEDIKLKKWWTFWKNRELGFKI